MLQDLFACLVIGGIALREVAKCANQGHTKERQYGQSVGGITLAVQVSAQRVEFRDVDFLNIGKVRNLAFGFAHSLGDDQSRAFGALREKITHRTADRSSHANCLSFLFANVNASQESRNEMGRLHRVEYDATATLSDEDREIALQLARKSVDLFIQRLLALFQCNGQSSDLKAGDQHAIAYELLLTFIGTDDLEPIETHAVNKYGEKVFSEYFGRWLNRYGKD